MLQEYFAIYLRKIRNVSENSIKHYFTSLSTISRYLIEYEIIDGNIYDIETIYELEYIKEYLFSQKWFLDLDTKGNRMYSAGLNNYIRFAYSDSKIFLQKDAIKLMDIVIPKKVRGQIKYKNNRDRIIVRQVLENIDYKCEIDEKHITFISASTNRNFLEGHHLIPMCHYDEFESSIDVYANILGVCPVCHRFLHYGIKEDKIKILHKLYANREERLYNSGIKINKNEFIELALES